MKRLFVSCVSLACGGAERVLSILSYSFAEKYDDVRFIMWKDFPIFYKINDKITIVNIEKECGSNNTIKKMLWFRGYISKNHPNLILSFLANSSVKVLLSTVGINIPIVVAERNDPRKLKGGWLMVKIRDFLYNRATAIIEQTETNKRYFKGSKYKKTIVIYNPILMDEENVGSGINAIKQNRIISIGRLEPQKNQKMLIDAFRIFHDKYSDTKLVIYGEGSCRSELESQIKSLKIEDAVLLPGTIDNVVEELKDSLFFVMSSDFEGMPNALIEAMCIGLPCISTRVSGAVDLINNNKNGILIDLGDTNKMAAAMIELMENENKRKDLGREAIKIFDQLKSERIVQEWINYVNKFIEKSN